MISRKNLLKLGVVSFFSIFFLFIIPIIISQLTETVELKYLYSDVGFSHGCTYYEIENNLFSELSGDTLKTIKNNKIIEKIGKLKNGVWEYPYEETYYIDVPKETCFPYEEILKNGTVIIPNCTTIYEKEQEKRLIWIPSVDEKINEMKIDPQDKNLVRFCGDFERIRTENGWEIAIDHIPEFYDKIYDKFTWWNTTYGYRYPINSNATNTIPIAVNDTFGIAGNIYWTKNTSETIYVYCENSGCGSGLIAIANETDEKDWEQENTGLGNSISSVWDNYLLVYHLNDTNNPVDMSGTGNDGTINQCHLANGVFGKALKFNGTDDYITVPNNFQEDSSYSICYWLNLTDTNDRYIWDFRYGEQGFNRINSNQFQGFIRDDGGTARWLYGGVLSTNTWYHICQIYNTTNVMLYKNGILNDTNVANGLKTDTLGNKIGSDYNANGDFAGMIDEFRYYNKTLSLREIQEQYWNGINNLTALGTEELNIVKKPTKISLYLNGTENNKSFDVGSYANFSAIINVTDLTIYMDVNYTGWNKQSGTTKYENITYLNTIGNYYNITAWYEGNNSFSPANATYFFNVTIPTITKGISDFGVDIKFIDEDFNIKVR